MHENKKLYLGAGPLLPFALINGDIYFNSSFNNNTLLLPASIPVFSCSSSSWFNMSGSIPYLVIIFKMFNLFFSLRSVCDCIYYI